MAFIDFSSAAIQLSATRPLETTRLIATGLKRYLEMFDFIQDLPDARFAAFDRKMEIVNLALAEIDDPERFSEAVDELDRLPGYGACAPEHLRVCAARNIAAAHATAFMLQERFDKERARNGLQPLGADIQDWIRGQIRMEFFCDPECRQATLNDIERLFEGPATRRGRPAVGTEPRLSDEFEKDLAA
jgi:hypothetical protein